MDQDNRERTPHTDSPENIPFVVIATLIVLIIVAIFGFWGYGIFHAKNVASTPEATATPVAEETASATSSASDYVVPASDANIITARELESLSEWQLKLARNEIYARHGRTFEHKDLQCYFNNAPWYEKRSEYSDSDLSETENKNIATIADYELEINSSYANFDSGCSSL